MTNDLTKAAFRIEDILATFWGLLNGVEDWIQGRETRANPKSPLLAFFGRTLGRIQAQRDATNSFLENQANNCTPFRLLSRNRKHVSLEFDGEGLPPNEDSQTGNGLEGHNLPNDERLGNHDLTDVSQELQGTNAVAIENENMNEIAESEREDDIDRAAASIGISTRAKDASTINNGQ